MGLQITQGWERVNQLFIFPSIKPASISLGVVDTTKPIQNEDGIRCAKVLCGEETANADFPEAEELIRECYKRHFPEKRSLSGQPNWDNPKCYEIDRIENELHKKWKAENDDRYVVNIVFTWEYFQ